MATAVLASTTDSGRDWTSRLQILRADTVLDDSAQIVLRARRFHCHAQSFAQAAWETGGISGEGLI